MSSVNPVSSLFTHGDIIKSLILLLNISLETWLLGHVCFETWESAAVYQQSRNKSCRIYTLNTHVRNVHNESQSERKIFVLVNNTHLSGTSSAGKSFLNCTKNTFWLFFHFIMSDSGCTICLCLLPVFCSVH